MINMKIKKDCLMKNKIFLLVQGLLFTGLLSAQVVHTDSTFSEKMLQILYMRDFRDLQWVNRVESPGTMPLRCMLAV